MKMTLKYMLISIILSLLLTCVGAGILLWNFPPANWRLLYEKSWMELPIFVFMLWLPVAAGAIIGLLFGVSWNQRLKRVARQLENLLKEQQITSLDGQIAVLKPIEKQITALQQKFRKQAAQSQERSTKRVEEREKSLQEVVIQERTRLARELHDSVSQQLFAASMLLSAINESEETADFAGASQLKMVEHTIHQSQLEMRALLLHLRPAALKGKTLQQGAEELLTELKMKLPLEVDWKIEAFSLEKGIEDQLFRILQESVSNTLRHADAHNLEVLLIHRDEWIILRVTDDGVGFDIKQETKSSSYGLDNMEERAQEIGGTFKLISLPSEGTRLEVKVPLTGNTGDMSD